jgi:hypothetical protein
MTLSVLKLTLIYTGREGGVDNAVALHFTSVDKSARHP